MATCNEMQCNASERSLLEWPVDYATIWSQQVASYSLMTSWLSELVTWEVKDMEGFSAWRTVTLYFFQPGFPRFPLLP
jgi:hypothetical protein